MSELLQSDIRNRAHIVRLLSDIKDAEPFADFDDNPFSDCRYSNLHLGNCPGLKQNLCLTDIRTCFFAVFRIMRPENKPPFIQYYLQKSADNRLYFPMILPSHLNFPEEVLAGMNKKTINTIETAIDNTLVNMGYFVDDRSRGIYYSLYEAKNYSLTKPDNDLASDTTSFIWVTPKEIMEKRIFNLVIEPDVIKYVSQVSEGACQLYDKGNFIPSPEIAYIGGTSAIINEVINGGYSNRGDKEIFIGNSLLGLLTAFFVVTKNDGIMEIGTDRKIGNILRLAYWKDTTTFKQNIFILKDEHYEEFNEVVLYNINVSDSVLLSKHVGRLLYRENRITHLDAETFIKTNKAWNSKLIIFD